MITSLTSENAGRNRGLKLWAGLATALSLFLGGILIGQRFDRQSGAKTTGLEGLPATGLPAMEDAPVDRSDPMAATPVSYTVPPEFSGMPVEWRTPVPEENEAAYAALFSPERRELIVEICKHPGYIDPVSGEPQMTPGEFCQPVLWSTIESLESTRAVARDRNGAAIELLLNYSMEEPLLSITFDSHSFIAVPGSKNDLFQDFEQSSEIAAEKREMMQLLQQEEERRRRERGAGGN